MVLVASDGRALLCQRRHIITAARRRVTRAQQRAMIAAGGRARVVNNSVGGYDLISGTQSHRGPKPNNAPGQFMPLSARQPRPARNADLDDSPRFGRRALAEQAVLDAQRVVRRRHCHRVFRCFRV